MDASNLATLFTPNVLHNFAEETAAATSSGVTFATSNNTEKLTVKLGLKLSQLIDVVSWIFYSSKAVFPNQLKFAEHLTVKMLRKPFIFGGKLTFST